MTLEQTTILGIVQRAGADGISYKELQTRLSRFNTQTFMHAMLALYLTGNIDRHSGKYYAREYMPDRFVRG